MKDTAIWTVWFREHILDVAQYERLATIEDQAGFGEGAVLRIGGAMAKSKKVFAIHPGEILKTEFMEPMGISAYVLAKALKFHGIYEVVRGDRSISADTAIRLGKYFDLPAQFWLNLQSDYDLRIAEGSGIGRRIRPRAPADLTEFGATS